MTYLKVSVTGLRDKHHPALANQITTFEVQKSRPHLKMLTKDYFTYEKRADQSGGSPHCRCCGEKSDTLRPNETIFHILVERTAYTEVRDRMFQEYETLCSTSQLSLEFQNIIKDKNTLCQFILDPSSLNLSLRVNINDPNLKSFFRKSRYICYSIHNKRMNILKKEDNKQKQPTN